MTSDIDNANVEKMLEKSYIPKKKNRPFFTVLKRVIAINKITKDSA